MCTSASSHPSAMTLQTPPQPANSCRTGRAYAPAQANALIMTAWANRFSLQVHCSRITELCCPLLSPVTGTCDNLAKRLYQSPETTDHYGGTDEALRELIV